MTPEQLTGLGYLLLEFREWIREYSSDAPLDVEVVDHTIEVIALYRRMLVADGAR